LPSSTLEATPAPTDLLARFRRDLPYYAAACLKITTKDARLVHLEMNRAQQIVHEKLAKQRRETGWIRAIILKARQEGVSTWIAARFFRAIHLWSNTQALVVADEDDRSGILYEIYDRFYENLPPELRIQKRTSLKRKRRALANGSELAVETARDVQAGRAMTVQRLHISELAAWVNADTTMTSLLSAVPPLGSEIVIESTAQGVGNRFHRMWEDAESGNSEWIPIFLPWWIHEEYRRELDDDQRDAILQTLSDWEREAFELGIEWEGELHLLDLEQIAWRRATIANLFEGDERTFRQEFPSTALEAFLVSGNAFFDEEALQDYVRRARPPEIRGNLLKESGGIILRPATRGYLRVWEMPAKGGHYVIGADTAEGKLAAARDTGISEPDAERGGRDFNSADVILVEEEVESRDSLGKLERRRERRMRQVATLHGRMAPEVFAEQLHMLGYLYSCAGVLGRRTTRVPALEAVERNHASGQTILRILRKELRYPRLFWHRRVNVRVEKPSDVLGWVTNVDTRRPMLDELGRALRQGSIDIPSADTIREMTTFVMGDDGEPEAQEGCHDDRVLSLGITLQMALHHHSDDEPVPAPEPEVADTPTGL
jgi:hypothetical protein